MPSANKGFYSSGPAAWPISVSVPAASASFSGPFSRLGESCALVVRLLYRCAADQPRSVPIHSSIASGSRGSAADRFRDPSAVTTRSSSIRMPIPRSSSGTSRSSSWK